MLSAKDLGVEVAVPFCGDGFSVCLPANLDALLGNEGNVFWDEGVVKRVEVERGAWLGVMSEWRWHRAVEWRTASTTIDRSGA